MSGTLEFCVLGALEVRRGGERLVMPSRLQRALLTRLLLSAGHVVGVGELAIALWDGDSPERARHALHTNVSRLRQRIGGDVLVTRSPGYLLAVDPGSVDATRFEREVREAGALLAEDPGAAAEKLETALGRWRGAAYAEFADGFAQGASVRLSELRLAAQESRCEAWLMLGRRGQALGELGELTAAHPLRERPHGLLMQALYLAGRQAEALEVYRSLSTRFREELGLEPSPELDRLHTQILCHQLPVQAPQNGPLRDEAPPDEAPRTGTPRSEPVPGRPLTALPGRPLTALPGRPLTALVGRAAELARLTDLLDSVRIVTLVGPGGVGKTRLAREVAASRAASWIDLAAVRDPADVPHVFADALGLPEPISGGVEQALVEALRSSRTLLVADNCEHVLPAVAALVERIAQHCPKVSVLATSRELLAVPGEQVVTVPPLREPAQAVALFAERLRACGGPDLAPGDVPLATELCRRLDGLPLAIELAAARARGLGLATVTDRPALDVLSGGWRTSEPRHRSLRAVLDWSFALLEPPEQVLLRRLAVFSGRFGLADAETVCTDGLLPADRIAAALAGLADKSMVAGPDGDRYRLLDTVRAYSAELLARHGEDVSLPAAHARHQTAVARRHPYGPLPVDELRAALRWSCAHDADLAVGLAAALAPYALFHMRFEFQEWAATAAELPGAAGHPLRPAALASAASGAWARGDFARATELAQRALAAASPGSSASAGALAVLGDIALLEGRFTESIDHYDQAVRLADPGDAADLGVICDALGSKAIALAYQGDLVTALRTVDECRALADKSGEPVLRALALYYAGEARLHSDPARALELLEESRRSATALGALFIDGVATVSVVTLRGRVDPDPATALPAYRNAIEHWRRVGNQTQQWVTLRNLIPLLVWTGLDEAACELDGALATAPVRFPGDAPEAAQLIKALALARERLGADAVRRAGERGARRSLDDLAGIALTAIDEAAGGPPYFQGTTTSGEVEPVEAP
ncbi:AfsR/SARP family transcriptional regulator [Actinomadura sp. 6N118]|uniref:AfsR/SARP family transcriptional regulator n=1 Tax=Actinomadura sp. 6N118 TaxID=3375151 RepID=UPI00379A6FF5